jgi:hypothetical protein
MLRPVKLSKPNFQIDSETTSLSPPFLALLVLFLLDDLLFNVNFLTLLRCVLSPCFYACILHLCLCPCPLCVLLVDPGEASGSIDGTSRVPGFSIVECVKKIQVKKRVTITTRAISTLSLIFFMHHDVSSTSSCSCS